MAILDQGLFTLLVYILGIIGLFLVLYYVAIAGSDDEDE